MTDLLHQLAEAAGLALRWRDVHGQEHEVSPETLRAVLKALGHEAANDAQAAEGLAALQYPGRLPPLVTADAGGILAVPPGEYRLALTDGPVLESFSTGTINVPDVPGYHQLVVGDSETVLAVAPRRAWTIADAMPGQRPWALAAQLYALRRPGDGGIGDFGGLAQFVRAAASHGAAAVAISPVHAQFSATLDRFSPYSPSSRVLLNVLHAAVDIHGEEAARLEALDCIDWPAATRLRLQRLAEMFDAAQGTPLWDAFLAFRAAEGPSLEGHARFEALHAHFASPTGERWHWRHWPDGLSESHSPAVDAFARAHAQDVARHAFYQFLADRSFGQAQTAAREAGMPIGLIADLAVGVDSGGSQCWSRPDETLLGLTIGAPPDLLSPQGQSWGLVAFSPQGLVRNGFSAFLEMLRAAMRHAGGVRIDHAMGLARLWVLPDGARSAEGTYLHFPLTDMLRLVRLESLRHRAIVLGEDLGTVPDGFQHTLSESGILGMRVLWFERARDLGFTAPSGWDRGAAAMTSTHDLATVAGWWTGGDLGWRERLGLLGDAGSIRREHDERARDRWMLWSAMQASGAAQGDPPPPDQPAAAVDAAVRHVGRAACDLVVLPVEDALGRVEQPNLPGTMDDQHPNWRRRLPGNAADLLDGPAAASRLRDLAAARTPT
ncbi:MAG: 4-alpha-glucanotransferase [Acetobacteraceae bacterium]